MKDIVVIEPLYGQRVAVLDYDEFTDTTGSVICVTSRKEANRDYNIIGELINGTIKKFDDADDTSDVYDN